MTRWPLAVASLVLGGAIGLIAAGPFLRGEPAGAPVAVKEPTSFRDVVKKVLPAVVSIESHSKSAPVKDRKPEAEGPDDETLGFGSGFIVDPKGVVITNHHVVEGADEVTVYLNDAQGRKCRSKDIKSDPKSDLAIVRLDSKDALPFLELGDSDAMEIGDRVLAIGAPFGLRGSVTAGIISAKGRTLHRNKDEDFLQTDAAINPGNSGGPLINLDGKVIGVNSAIQSRTGGFQGIGLAIASKIVSRVKDQLLKDGAVHRGYLGVQIEDLDNEALAARLGVKGGVIVTRAFDDAPAAKGGVQEGDVIVSLGGKPISDAHTLQNAVASSPLGQAAKMEVVRDGKAKNLDITLLEQPADYGAAKVNVPDTVDVPKETTKVESLGAESVDVTADLAKRMGLKDSTRGALITKVERRGPAWDPGLRKGMIVVKVDGQPVTTSATLKEKLKGAEKDVLLQVRSLQGGVNYLLVKPESGAP
jgi:serine protease Do